MIDLGKVSEITASEKSGTPEEIFPPEPRLNV